MRFGHDDANAAYREAEELAQIAPFAGLHRGSVDEFRDLPAAITRGSHNADFWHDVRGEHRVHSDQVDACGTLGKARRKRS